MENKNNTENNIEHFHTYDGIIEHNNPMPLWWQWTFILCVIFGFLYYLHYEIGGGPTLQDELKIALNEIEILKVESAKMTVPITAEVLEKAIKDPQQLMNGATVYSSKCAMCHGENLQGKIGPNLTDKSWINGDGTALAISHVVENGSTVKGMPAWRGVLTDKEIISVVSYVVSKKGSNPNNAKSAEGIEYP